MSALSIANFNPDIVARRALGALHFVDACTGETVNDGLIVSAMVRNKNIKAIPSRSGVYVFHQLPGLLKVSYWDGEATPEPVPQEYEFKIEVRDSMQRFCSVTFNMNLADWPLAEPICQGVAFSGKQIQLYSTPWRIPRFDYAIVRGTLHDFETKKPAAWALLRIYRNADNEAIDKPVIEGIAGENGEFMLMFPWPRPDKPLLDQPTIPAWTVKILAWYDKPDAAVPAEALPDDVERLPQLCSILGQHKVNLLANTDPVTELSPQTIIPGKTLLLKTASVPPAVIPEQQILYLETPYIPS